MSVDLFCKQSGIKRHTTEAETPQSNGKAEMINRTIFIWSGACSLDPMYHLLSDAAEYAVLQPHACQRQASLPAGGSHWQITHIVVVFGSPCQIRRDPHKKSLKARTASGYILGKDNGPRFKRFYSVLTAQLSRRVMSQISQRSTLQPTSSSPIHSYARTTLN